jgi:hypothetical protein
MKIIFLFILPLAVFAEEVKTDMPWLASMIACDEKEERYVDEIYENAINLLSGETLKKGDHSFPIHFTEFRPQFAVVDRAYYITPNTFKSFELLIPREAIAIKDGMVTITVDLRLKSKSWRQGTRTLELAIIPSQAAEPTAQSGRSASILGKQR